MRGNLLTNPEKPRPAVAMVGAKGILVSIVTLLLFFNSFSLLAQLSEGFESGLPTAYTATTTYTLTSGTWTGQANGVIRGTAGVQSGSYSCQLRSQTGAQITSPNIASGGVSTVTFYGSASTTSGAVQVNYSTDGGATWTPATGSPFSLTTGSAVLKTATINSSSSNILIQFYRTAATVYLDDILISPMSVTPTISVSPTTLSGFTYVFGSGPSAEQTFTCSGTNLTANISLTAPTDYEISTTSGSGFGSSLTLTQSGGTVASTTIYVRLKAGLTAGSYNSETITASSAGATSQTVTCNGTVTTPVPTIAVSASTLSGFTYVEGSGPSAEQTIACSGTNLTADISLSAPADYEISTISGSGFTSSINLTQSGGTVASTSIYVRLKDGLSAGAYNAETITATSTGATSKTVTCNGIVTTSSSACISEGFSAGTTAPAGWTFTSIGGTYTSATNYGVASPSLQMDATGDQIVTATVTSATQLSFWIKGQSTNAASALLVEGYNGSWVTIDNITNSIPTTGTIYTYNASSTPALAAGFTQFRFTYTKSAGNLSFDDVEVLCVTGPTLSVTPATLTGFSYSFGSGPSASQTYALSGTNLTGFPGNITVTAPVDYQISLDGSTWNSTLSVPYSSATLAATTIYVRLIAGLSAGTYNNEVIENSGGGAVTTAEVTCSGTVTGPTLLVSPSSISMSYVFGAGPSAEQTYSISGSSLGAGPITINAPANFEISLTSGSGFGSSVNISYTAPTLNATIIYVRLISGLAINNYSGTITNSGGGASVNVGVSGVVSDPAALPTVFLPGDLAIIGVNSNAKCETGDDGSDEISFVSFVNINTGTKFYATDNGYQRTTAGKWGDTEGVYEFTRTGGPISAGTVITFRFLNITPFVQFLSPDNGWTFTKVSGFGGNLVLNTNGDQIYFMQGGTWTNGAALHDATYTPGVYLFAFNTNDSWTDFGASTQESGLIPGMECFSMMPGVATDFIKFTAAVSGWSAISKRGWIDRINSTANWTDCRVLPTSDPLFTTYSCENYTNTVTPDYPAGYSISIAAGGFSPGIWTGSRDENWFNCGNWQDMTIPDHNVNVSIPSAGVTFEPTIGNPPTVPVVYIGAECNDIDVQTGRTLTMNHANSRLDVYGNMINNGTFSFTDGIVNFMEDNSTLSGTGNMDFYKLGMVKTTALNTLTISKDINISNSLLFTSGIITTGSFRVNVTNSATAAISGHVIPGSSAFTGFINGNLRRNVAATGSYDFPVGSATQYEYANINLISSSSLSYIDAFFTTPHSTTIDITPLNLMVGTSTLNELLNYGFWTITPNAGTYTYDVLLTERLHTNPGSSADAHTVVKRPNAASNWVLQGTHLNSTQSMGTTPVNWVTAKRSGLTVFSDFAIAKSNSGTLPVELLGFDAYLSNGNGFLSWSTASETNCRMFVVERSVNDMNEFVTVATIAGNGNSNMINKYLVEDKNVQPGINYYRLVQYDYDGTRNELGVRYLVMSNEDEPISIATISNDGNSVYADVINIRNGSFEVQILDASGKLVYSAISQSGDDAYRIKVYNLPSGGVYMMRVSDGISADVKKFMIF